MSNPLISIIILTFNRPYLLKKALISLKNQSYPNIEIILINNAGESVENMIFHLTLPNLIYLNLQNPVSRGQARNIGIKKASGKYLAFLDDDDFFYPEHISTHIDFFKNHPKYKVAYSSSIMNVLDNDKITEKIDFIANNYDYDSLLVKGYIPILSVVFEKDCLNKAIYFDEVLNWNEDWDFWLKIAQNHDFGFINKITNEFYYQKNRNLSEYYQARKILYRRYQSKKRFSEVEEERNKLLELEENNKSYFWEQGKYFYECEKYELALAFFNLYLEKNLLTNDLKSYIKLALEKLELLALN